MADVQDSAIFSFRVRSDFLYTLAYPDTAVGVRRYLGMTEIRDRGHWDWDSWKVHPDHGYLRLHGWNVWSDADMQSVSPYPLA